MKTALDIKKGNQYTRYIAKSNCEYYNLGMGDTFFSVAKMREWVLQDYTQVTKLAKILKKPTLSQTVATIHRFLHNHIAYDADGRTQVIKSPGCTWASRDQGTDCKTFSVFASSLLLNMGIPHAIRQVRQPGESEFQSLWTHVYVVVPVNPKDVKIKGNYYVLDGTVGSNREVIFIDKNDEFMPVLPHIGLRGAQNGAYRSGLSNPVTDGFALFLQMLVGVGVTKKTVDAIRAEVNKYISMGVDPTFAIISQGVVVQGRLFPYIPTGYRGRNPLKDAIVYVENKSGLGLGNPESESEGDGETIEQVANTITESGFFQNTFGAVFQNGFDFSCFGSATNPKKMADNVKVDLPHYFDKSKIEQSATIQNIRNFFYYMEVYRFGAAVLERKKYASCTRKAGKLGREATEAFTDYMIGAIDATLRTQNKRLRQVSTRSVAGPHELETPSGRGGGSIRLGETLQVFDFVVEAIPNTQQVNTPPPPVPKPDVEVAVSSSGKPTIKPTSPGVKPVIRPTSTNRPTNPSTKPTVTGGANSNRPSSSKVIPQTAGFGTTEKVLISGAVLYGLYQLYNSKRVQSN